MMKSKKGRPRYSISQSPFYRLKSIHTLAKLLDVNVDRLSPNDPLFSMYREGEIVKTNGKIRPTETPVGALRIVHERILKLFKRIDIPDFVHSVKGKSYITNAAQHIGNAQTYCLDIEQFFRSTRRHHVFDFFRNYMRCASDVAGILASLCTVENYLPTGSPISTLLSYFIHKETFDTLNNIAGEQNITMTLYVDDLTFSSRSVPYGFRKRVQNIIRGRGLRYHKQRKFFQGSPREITGVIVHRSGLTVPKRRHLAAYNETVALWNAGSIDDREGHFKRALSRLSEGAQIEERMKRRKNALKAAKLQIFRAVST